MIVKEIIEKIDKRIKVGTICARFSIGNRIGTREKIGSFVLYENMFIDKINNQTKNASM